MKSVTITMKIEVNLEGVPPENLGRGLAMLQKECRDWKEELEQDFQNDPEMAERVKVSVEVDRKL